MLVSHFSCELAARLISPGPRAKAAFAFAFVVSLGSPPLRAQEPVAEQFHQPIGILPFQAGCSTDFVAMPQEQSFRLLEIANSYLTELPDGRVALPQVDRFGECLQFEVDVTDGDILGLTARTSGQTVLSWYERLIDAVSRSVDQGSDSIFLIARDRGLTRTVEFSSRALIAYGSGFEDYFAYAFSGPSGNRVWPLLGSLSLYMDPRWTAAPVREAYSTAIEKKSDIDRILSLQNAAWSALRHYLDSEFSYSNPPGSVPAIAVPRLLRTNDFESEYQFIEFRGYVTQADRLWEDLRLAMSIQLQRCQADPALVSFRPTVVLTGNYATGSRDTPPRGASFYQYRLDPKYAESRDARRTELSLGLQDAITDAIGC